MSTERAILTTHKVEWLRAYYLITFFAEKCWPAPFDFTPRIVGNKSLEEVFVEPLPEEYDPDQEAEKQEIEEEEGDGEQPEV